MTFVLSTQKRRSSITDIFVTNLTLADFIFLSFLPFWIVEMALNGRLGQGCQSNLLIWEAQRVYISVVVFQLDTCGPCHPHYTKRVSKPLKWFACYFTKRVAMALRDLLVTAQSALLSLRRDLLVTSQRKLLNLRSPLVLPTIHQVEELSSFLLVRHKRSPKTGNFNQNSALCSAPCFVWWPYFAQLPVM